MNTASPDVLRKQQLIESAIAKLDDSEVTDAKSWLESLLARAPTELLQVTASAALAEMMRGVLDAIELASRSSTPVYNCSPEHGLMITVLPDRPFIVNTLLECCRRCDLSPRAVLHPVVRVGEKSYSVTVIVASPQAANELRAVDGMLKLCISELVLATDAYPKMKEVLVSRMLASDSLDPKIQVDSETRAFLEWLVADGFNLFGVSSGETKLGILSDQSAHGPELHREFNSHGVAEGSVTIECFSSQYEAQFHRFKPLTNMIISVGSRRVFVSGLFTSRALNQECQSIPLLRKRFAAIVNRDGIALSTHDTKSVACIIDSLPKEEALSLSDSQLHEIVSSVIDVGTSRETAVTVWPNTNARVVSVAAFQLAEVYQPSTRHEFFDHLAKRFGGVPFIDELHLDIANRAMVRIYARVSIAEGSLNLDSLKSELEALARSWHSDLEVELAKHGVKDVEEVTSRYYSAFSAGYQNLQSAQDCVQDIQAVESLSPTNPISVGLGNFDPSQPNEATIIISSATSEVTISHCVPALESFGFEVINERKWVITPHGQPPVVATRFRVRTRSRSPINPENFRVNVSPVCARTLTGLSDIDPLNALHTDVALPYRAVSALRAYCRLLWQVSKSSSRLSVMRALSSNPHLAAKLWQLFDLKFNPACSHTAEERQRSLATENAALLEALRAVTDINADRAFRQLRTLIEHTVRTSHYREGDAIALKIDSQRVDFIPQPRPYFEIFVSSPLVEGIHLRAGAVARGGIRWSDRPDDYRTEVLGLMKTQRVKNSLIVPTGAKGGFIVKNLPTDQKLIAPTVVAAYKEYIRALLSVADNRVEGQVVHPQGVMIYDRADPYFVVAADKGTATFSDTANGLATDEFNFWLADAFASGGSNGYDHKLYAITAAGTWECVKRHFKDLGTSVDAAPFSAVGIGDMAGDVFGNGLLMSRNFKLIAAFNHNHIFIDPTPNPAVSFEERKRLFDLKGSQWSDYNPALISKGGAVFNRFDKELRLSAEARAAIGITPSAPEALSGDDVITAILKAPVDLLWNGGIGTYVKASYQAHSDAGDGANDSVRVSAPELRARVIGEGGNLGFTQAARIEFNRLGGKLNTDAIDNSAGVDLSDHEVNLKLLFADMMRSGSLTKEARNKLLKDMAKEVCELVLDHNRSQAMFLSVAEQRSARNMPYLARLLRELSKLGYVNRALDNLPEEDAIRERERSNSGFTRPELAVCLSTTKMWVKDVLLESNILESELTDEFCLEYFPTAVVTQFRAAALKHPLRRNIVATQIANTLVDTLGVTSLLKLASRAGKPMADAVRAAINAELVLNTRATRVALLRDEAALSGESFIAVNQSLATMLGQLSAWFMGRYSGNTDIALTDLLVLRRAVASALSGEVSILPEVVAAKVKAAEQELIAQGVAGRNAQLLAWSPHILSLIEINWIAAQYPQANIADAAKLYFTFLESTGCATLLRTIAQFRAADGWEAELLPGLANDLRAALAVGTVRALQTGMQELPGADQMSKTIEEAVRGTVKASTLAVFARQMVSLLK